MWAQRIRSCATAATRPYSLLKIIRRELILFWHEYLLHEPLWSKNSGSQSCGPRPAALASPGDLKEMPILGPHPRLNQKLWGRAQQSVLTNPSGHFDAWQSLRTPALTSHASLPRPHSQIPWELSRNMTAHTPPQTN